MLLFSEAEKKQDAKGTPKEKISYERRKKTVEGKLPEGTRFPEHLPREEEIIDEGGEGTVIIEKVSERLCARPSAFYVKRIVRKVRKYEGELKTPALPAPVIEGTTADVSFLTWVILAKFVWHLPLYRQEQMLKSQMISMSRDTLIRYVISVADLLRPIYVSLGSNLFEESHLYSDETPILVGKRKDGDKKFSESRFWGFLGTKGVIFYYTPTRAYKEVEPLIKSFSGYLQVDGYTVYEKLSREYPEIVLVGCWAHSRRMFVDAEKGGNAPEASEALRYIRALYRVERRVKEQGLSPPDTVRLRRRFSKKILSLFRKWLREKAADPRLLPKGLFWKAVTYTLDRWDALNRYTEDAVLTIDSNSIEQQIRPIALGKKNWMFCDSEVGAESAAILYSLIGSCKLAGVDPWRYFIDVLERISVHQASKVEELIPVNWKLLVQKEQEEKEAEKTRLAQVA